MNASVANLSNKNINSGCLMQSKQNPCWNGPRYVWPRIRVLLALLCLLTFAMQSAAAAETPTLDERLVGLINEHNGIVAVAVKHLPTGESFVHNADRPLPTASLIKFPIMVEAFYQAAQDQLRWDQMIALRDEDKVPGSGLLTDHFSAGTQLRLQDVVRLMIAFSDNTATNLVIDQIGLPATAQRMEQLGLPNTKLHSKVFRRDTTIFPERSKQFGLGSTTANEMVRLYELLWTDKLVSAEACQRMREHLLACDDRSKIIRFLPPGTRFAHKTGAVSRSRCDAGVIDGPQGPTIICVLTTENEDQSWTDDNAANRLCAEIGREVYGHFHGGPNSQRTTADSRLAIGATGRLVEMLQRTLNKRLTPSPDLGVDGDFGPATQRALIAFQTSRNLPASGVVDKATWQALGDLITQDEEVPPPAVINAQVLDQRPRDPSDGPPHVTCKAWVIVDAESAEVLAGHDPDKPLDVASTTKIMTALVALQCCQRDPRLLDEVIVFSAQADATEGSSAGIRTGERVPVKELLFGLLLPSGNDASVALAEFFGRHVQAAGNGGTESEISDEESHDRFIAAMNATAADLGLTHTSFQNPHGLTAPGHVASAADLASLTRQALQHPLFREIVSTRQRGYTVEAEAGYRRNLVWKNTNRLLEIEGYQGIKTGTTSAAGACLVSYGQRDDRELIVVVLGASSSDARFVDTRNLFRWAWNELAETSGKESPTAHE